MTTQTPSTNAAPSNAVPWAVTTGVSAVTIVALVVLLAMGKTTWAEVGPLIGTLAGGNAGGALTAIRTR